jgi:pimeloyl-ACP methyl ester carboxylesterase
MSATNALDANDGSGAAAGAGGMAEVRANGRTTRYRRGGTGSPILLLCDASDDRFGSLFGELAQRFRVIAPVGETDPGVAGAAVDRLADFLDGLGVGSIPVVGVGRAAGPAAAFSRLHPDRCDRLVLLGLDVGEPEHHVAACLEALGAD